MLTNRGSCSFGYVIWRKCAESAVILHALSVILQALSYVASQMIVWSWFFCGLKVTTKPLALRPRAQQDTCIARYLLKAGFTVYSFAQISHKYSNKNMTRKFICLILFWKPITRKRIQNKTKDVDHPPRAFETVPARMVRRIENGIAVRNSDAKISSAPSNGATGHCWAQKMLWFLSCVQTYIVGREAI